MAEGPEPTESLKDKTIEALKANSPGMWRPSSTFAEEVELRLQAIRTVRNLEPKRACQSEVYRILKGRLVDTPSDSIHHDELLEQLRAAHAELGRLEHELWKANHRIRSTQWLVELLDDPHTLG